MIAEVMHSEPLIDYIECIWIENIQRWEQSILGVRATKKLQKINGLRIIGTAAAQGRHYQLSCRRRPSSA